MSNILLSWVKSPYRHEDFHSYLYNGIHFGNYILAPAFIFIDIIQRDSGKGAFYYLIPDKKCVREVYFIKVFRSQIIYELMEKRFSKRMLNVKTSMFLYSLFILFGISKDQNIDEIFKDLMLQCFPVTRDMIGNAVITRSTPFGKPYLYNTECRGILSNLVDGVFLIIDVNLTPSCTGGSIYNENGRLIGMVINVIYKLYGSSTNFTLGVSLHAIVSEYLNQKAVAFLPDASYTAGPLQNVMESAVVVLSGTSMGSGVVIDHERGIVLTCAHVVKHKLGNVNVYHRDKENVLTGKVIYATTPKMYHDLAVIRINNSKTINRHFSNCVFSHDVVPLKIGESVYSLGFPLYPSSYEPAFSSGNVAAFLDDLILVTCNTIKGTSGGPLIRPNGDLVGIMKATIAEDKDNGIRQWSHYGIAVSFEIFSEPISEFLKTGDINALQRITVTKTNRKVENLSPKCRL